MVKRCDTNAPMILWICAALCLHYGAGRMAEWLQSLQIDREALRQVAEKARVCARNDDQVLEIAMADPLLSLSPSSLQPPSRPTPQEPKLLPLQEPSPPKEPEEIPPVVVPPSASPPPSDNRIAIRQHAKEGQSDHPTARFLANKANYVKEETVARQTALDQDDPSSSPGLSHAMLSPHQGDGDRTKIAQSEETQGDPHSNADQPREGEKAAVHAHAPSVPTRGNSSAALSPQDSDWPPPAFTHSPSDPSLSKGNDELQHSARDGWVLSLERPSEAQQRASSFRSNGGNVRFEAKPRLGLGHRGPAGEVNFNLTHEGVFAVLGEEKIHALQARDRQRRKSEHQGKWARVGIERWRNAIENYVSFVKAGNQTALNAAASPFATYLNTIHLQIHPIFADGFLASLQQLPKGHPMNDLKLFTRLEIVLNQSGNILKMGVVRTSGVLAFDLAALEAVQEAVPFVAAPESILSFDGNVYLHWEFHRDEVYACSTMHARPFLLKGNSKSPSVVPDGNHADESLLRHSWSIR
ncbi:TonB C-terminal domain-containing protein [Pajaroellobacter abortibovis]|uniref:TonB C-terminal domain-containing protein n=1 Tax=Pajaroellobacter abortibovis TaxID=1882918 RepID=A0A1L6MW53_9BACT|nr:TonB C-terminal domain-containing protein [Pajaroellobacter abortibovis]APR99667.1 hypothetical protein BCY86_02480 [Pajaroellobacter abortibovis]